VLGQYATESALCAAVGFGATGVDPFGQGMYICEEPFFGPAADGQFPVAPSPALAQHDAFVFASVFDVRLDIDVTDSENGTGSASTSVTVNNVAPTVTLAPVVRARWLASIRSAPPPVSPSE